MAPFVIQGSAPDVLQIQQALNRAGNSLQPRLVEDGIHGPKTRARVLEFQRSRGLVPDGIVGSRTRAALGLASAPGAPATPAPGAVDGANVVTAVVSATKAAFAQWKQFAVFSGIVINGVTASGRPGCLSGPNIGPLIMASAAGVPSGNRPIVQAAATGIGTSFATWQNGVTVPGLPWYPSFAAFPGAFAPPTPNVPMPLMALPSSGLSAIVSPGTLRAAMEQAASASVRASAAQAFRDIASEVAVFFQASLGSTIVANVLGQGPVPTFAPPMVPVGPVIGGSTLPVPGQLR